VIKPLSQIARLRELLEAQEAEGMQSLYPQPSQKVVIEKVKVEPPPLQKPRNGERPPRLKGLSVGDILVMQADGELTLEEEEWLSLKSIPNPDGSMRMPNIKALMRRTQVKSDNA
jgi:hypothetical protein